MRSQSKAPHLPPHRLCFPDFSLELTVNVTNLHSGTELDLSADDRHRLRVNATQPRVAKI
jgi:hypothetical protein